MTEFTAKDILFIGLSGSQIGWYRCYLPAYALGADWIGVLGTPPNFQMDTMSTTKPINFDDYAVIIVQQPWGNKWFKWIKARQAAGVKVIYEVDDDLRAAAKLEHHKDAKLIKGRLKDYELCMRICDAIIVATQALDKRYQFPDVPVFVCESGIDFERYQLQRPARDYPTIGWSGGSGHEKTLLPLLDIIRTITKTTGSQFVSVGVDYASLVGGLSIPGVMIENYPAALTNFDIALAPSEHNNFFKAKGIMRWVEASAMGIPVIADSFIYDKIEDGKTGLIANTPMEFAKAIIKLINYPDLRTEIGEQAREHVKQHYHIGDRAEAWIKVLEAVVT